MGNTDLPHRRFIGVTEEFNGKLMKVIYNAKPMEEGEFLVKNTDRAFRYGDGLFETIIYDKGKISLLDRHLRRLKGGMRIFRLEADILTEENIRQQIESLAALNQIKGTGRVRLQVWRKEGGLYTPDRQQANLFLTMAPFEKKEGKVIEHAAISEEVYLYKTSTSRFKTCNALPYILAGIEKKERKLDDLVLRDHQGNIAECTSANIFWVKDGVYFTPSLDTGCVAGVMRGYLIDKLTQAGKKPCLVQETIESLLQADSVFACNVTGIFPVRRIEGKIFDIAPESLPGELYDEC